MKICAAHACKSKCLAAEPTSGKGYHKFPSPKNATQLSEWIKFCERKPAWRPQSYEAVCSDHFPQTVYEIYDPSRAKYLFKAPDRVAPTIKVNLPKLLPVIHHSNRPLHDPKSAGHAKRSTSSRPEDDGDSMESETKKLLVTLLPPPPILHSGLPSSLPEDLDDELPGNVHSAEMSGLDVTEVECPTDDAIFPAAKDTATSGPSRFISIMSKTSAPRSIESNVGTGRPRGRPSLKSHSTGADVVSSLSVVSLIPQQLPVESPRHDLPPWLEKMRTGNLAPVNLPSAAEPVEKLPDFSKMVLIPELLEQYCEHVKLPSTWMIIRYGAQKKFRGFAQFAGPPNPPKICIAVAAKADMMPLIYVDNLEYTATEYGNKKFTTLKDVGDLLEELSVVGICDGYMLKSSDNKDVGMVRLPDCSLLVLGNNRRCRVCRSQQTAQTARLSRAKERRMAEIRGRGLSRTAPVVVDEAVSDDASDADGPVQGSAGTASVG